MRTAAFESAGLRLRAEPARAGAAVASARRPIRGPILAAAAVLGPAVPRGPTAIRLRRVHGPAAYFEAEGSPFLCCLLSGECDDLPNGIRLGGRFDFRDAGLVPGLEGSLGCGRLVLDLEAPGPADPGRAGGFAFEAELSRAARPELVLRGAPAPGPAFELCVDRLELLRRERGGLLSSGGGSGGGPGPDAGAGGALAERLRDAATALALAAAARATGKAAEAALRLLGLGSGTTPSGDDFLCGFMAGFGGGAAGPEESSLVAALRAAVEPRLGSTTEESAGFLRCAFAGFAQRSLVELGAALAEASALEAGVRARGPRGRYEDSASRARYEDTVSRARYEDSASRARYEDTVSRARYEDTVSRALEALERLCGFGHSSGVDLAAGYFSGLAARFRPAPYKAAEGTGTKEGV